MQIARDSLTELRSGCSNNNSQSYCDSRRGSQLLPSSGTRRRPARRLLSLPRSRLVPALLIRCHERSFPPSPISVRLEERGGFWARLPSVHSSLRAARIKPAAPIRASYPSTQPMTPLEIRPSLSPSRERPSKLSGSCLTPPSP